MWLWHIILWVFHYVGRVMIDSMEDSCAPATIYLTKLQRTVHLEGLSSSPYDPTTSQWLQTTALVEMKRNLEYASC